MFASLRETQVAFTYAVGRLILHVAENPGWAITLGECYRPAETALMYERKGLGIANSLHTKRLAIDVNLFYQGHYCTDTSSYEWLANYWKTLDKRACWGGDFEKRPDGNHFSFTWEGVR